MKLEQTIQRSQMSIGGIIGQTKQSGYITKWKIVYHKIFSISNTFREITGTNLGSRETEIYSMLTSQVKKVAEFILKKGNPYTKR